MELYERDGEVDVKFARDKEGWTLGETEEKDEC